MNSVISTFTDKKHVGLRFLESVIGVVFLVFIISVAPLEKEGFMALPVIFIPSALIVDGMIRFSVLSKGIVIDRENDTLIYPKTYSRYKIKLSEITSLSSSKTLHTDAQPGVNLYTYDLVIEGSFGRDTLIFSSKKVQKRVLDALKVFVKEEEKQA
jgi:hypothetical protein